MRRSVARYFKNMARHAIYKAYRLYKARFEHKISVYDLQTIDIIHTLPEDAVCVDIGVNEGQIFRYLFRHCKKGKIYGFEPIPDLYDYLAKTYSDGRAIFNQLALSDKGGRLTFYYFPKSSAMSGLSRRTLEQSAEYKAIDVEVKTLDSIFSESRLDFVKIDVEGAELMVLRGARETILKHKPLLVVESGIGGMEFFNHAPDDLFEFFEEVGYSISTMKHFLNKRKPLERMEFVQGFLKGYEYQYIAYPCGFVPAA